MLHHSSRFIANPVTIGVCHFDFVRFAYAFTKRRGGAQENPEIVVGVICGAAQRENEIVELGGILDIDFKCRLYTLCPLLIFEAIGFGVNGLFGATYAKQGQQEKNTN